MLAETTEAAEMNQPAATALERIAAANSSDPAADDLTVPLAIELAEKDSEIGWLRTALQKIADLSDSEADEPLDDAIAIARKALEQ